MLWQCLDYSFEFGAPMVNPNNNTNERLGHCPYCGIRKIKLSNE